MDEQEEETYELQEELKKAKTFSFSESGVAERSESASWIEVTTDAKQYDMDSVKDTFRMEGYDLDEPPPPDPEAVKKALERSDPTADYRRNRKDYGIICPVCHGTGKCVECRGRGRRKLIFKCKNCGGTGKCPDCERDIKVHCPNCDEPISKYADTCSSCGHNFSCESCGAPLPAMATRCLRCKTEFKCDSCGKPYPRHYSWRCPHCRHWNEKND